MGDDPAQQDEDSVQVHVCQIVGHKDKATTRHWVEFPHQRNGSERDSSEESVNRIIHEPMCRVAVRFHTDDFIRPGNLLEFFERDWTKEKLRTECDGKYR